MPACYFILILYILILKHIVLKLAKKFNQKNRKPECCPKLMKPQKNALDFYLLACPVTQTVRTPEIQMDRDGRVTACCPWAIKKASASMPSHNPLNSPEGCSTEEGWVWLLQLVQHHCHIFVRQDKCLCKKNYTQVSMPTSYHPSNRGKYQYSTATWVVFTEMTGFKSIGQYPQA